MGKTRILSAREGRTLRAAAEIILPDGGAISLGHSNVDYHAFVNEYLTVVPKDVSLLLLFILWFLEYTACLFVLRPGRFSRMRYEHRRLALDRLRTSRLFFLRGFFILLSGVIFIPFYSDTRVMEAIGYGGHKPKSNKIDPEIT